MIFQITITDLDTDDMWQERYTADTWQEATTLAIKDCTVLAARENLQIVVEREE